MKKLLICLTVLFSAFLFTNSVSASDVLFESTSDGFFYGGFTKENLQHIIDYNSLDTTTYDSVIIYSFENSQNWHFLYIMFYKSSQESRLSISENTFIGIRNKSSAFYYATDYRAFHENKGVQDMGTYTFNWTLSEETCESMSVTSSEILYKGLVADALKTEPDTFNITLHLNGGIADDNNWVTGDGGSYLVGMKYEDYTITVPGDNLISYLREVYITKEPMQFVGWYYDEKLTQKVEATDTIDSDKHFYAKYQYKNVEDFLNNTTFNSYTFDENYNYAVISLNNQQNRDIYLGLGIMSHSLEVYKYDKNNNVTLEGSTSCLTPIYSKEDKYYYQVSDSLDNTYEVLILEKEKLNGNYEFLLSDNAYVTYTNDLKNLVIKDDDGNDLTIDIEDSYNYSQDNLLNSENDLLEIFKDLINNKDNNVFSYFNQVWNYMKQNKLFVYFMTLIIGSLIILIIKAASR